MSKLVLGTRGSDLALAQTRMVAAALQAAHPDLECETRIIKTIGDRRQDLKLTEFGSAVAVDKGIFTKELEVALSNDEIDVAVHSLKDVPTELEEAFEISAVLPREDTRDVLLSKHACPQGLASLPEGARLATSSVRRQAQLRWKRPDLQIDEIRGNVPTRLSKLVQQEELEGILLAMAGLKRLGYLDGLDGTEACVMEWEGQPVHVTPLGPPEFLPACGQGAVALETRVGDDAAGQRLASINDEGTFRRIVVERLILERLQAGCHTPVGVDTALDDAGTMRVHLRVFDEDHLDRPPQEAVVDGKGGQAAGSLVDDLMQALK